MARIDFNQVNCDSIQFPSIKENEEALETTTVPNWTPPFTAPFYVKVLNAPYGGNLLDPTMEGIMGWPYIPGDGGVGSSEYLLKTTDNSCYALSTVRNPSLYIRFRAEGRNNNRRFNPNLVVKTVANNLYSVEYSSPLTNEIVQFLVWKP